MTFINGTTVSFTMSRDLHSQILYYEIQVQLCTELQVHARVQLCCTDNPLSYSEKTKATLCHNLIRTPV